LHVDSCTVVTPNTFSAPTAHATKRAAYQQKMLKTRYNAAALLFSVAKMGDHIVT
jgi:hypothetical protein